jgi:hypothetical protein
MLPSHSILTAFHLVHAQGGISFAFRSSLVRISADGTVLAGTLLGLAGILLFHPEPFARREYISKFSKSFTLFTTFDDVARAVGDAFCSHEFEASEWKKISCGDSPPHAHDARSINTSDDLSVNEFFSASSSTSSFSFPSPSVSASIQKTETSRSYLPSSTSLPTSELPSDSISEELSLHSQLSMSGSRNTIVDMKVMENPENKEAEGERKQSSTEGELKSHEMLANEDEDVEKKRKANANLSIEEATKMESSAPSSFDSSPNTEPFLTERIICLKTLFDIWMDVSPESDMHRFLCFILSRTQPELILFIYSQLSPHLMYQRSTPQSELAPPPKPPSASLLSNSTPFPPNSSQILSPPPLSSSGSCVPPPPPPSLPESLASAPPPPSKFDPVRPFFTSSFLFQSMSLNPAAPNSPLSSSTSNSSLSKSSASSRPNQPTKASPITSTTLFGDSNSTQSPLSHASQGLASLLSMRILSSLEAAPLPLRLRSSTVALIANYITYRDFRIFRAIHPSELIGLNWTKSAKAALAPKVTELIEHFNQTAVWISSSIVSEKDLRRRVQKISSAMDLLEELVSLRNWHGVQIVIAALSHSSVSRLKRTWAAIDKGKSDIYQERERVFSPLKNWSACRLMVKEGGTPAIPYIGITLSDLVFIEEGNADTVQDDGVDLINFQKYVLQSDTIHLLLQYQTHHYRFDQQIVALAESSPPLQPILSENDLYSLSLLAEPRERKN